MLCKERDERLQAVGVAHHLAREFERCAAVQVFKLAVLPLPPKGVS